MVAQAPLQAHWDLEGGSSEPFWEIFSDLLAKGTQLFANGVEELLQPPGLVVDARAGVCGPSPPPLNRRDRSQLQKMVS